MSTQNEEIIRLYVDEKLTYRAIGERIGIPYWEVRKVVVGNGLSRTHSESKKGHLNPCWNGGRKVVSSGHIKIYCPEHPYADVNRSVFEHRLVMEAHLGRYLEQHELIHHVDGNPANNELSNLEIVTRSEHGKKHGATEASITAFVTHCRNGHTRTPENTATERNGSRRCLDCRKVEWESTGRAKRIAKRAAQKQ